MFLRKLDFLSPQITLYYKGEQSHSSILSGILSVIGYSICLLFAFVYAIEFINKENPQVYYYNRYIEDAGKFSLNSSSMFHFIQIIDTESNNPDVMDFDLLTIIGIEETIDLYQEDNDLSNNNHWLYGPCNNSTDIKGIDKLISFNYFTESACIRKYYNKDDKKYYNTNDKNFRWPTILHGCSNPNRTFYGIIIEKCTNSTLKLLSDNRYCKSKNDIINYIKLRSINFYIIDHFTDILNYSTPYRKYLYGISTGIFEDSYTTNHLNFNPTKLISDEGIFYSHKKETLSYIFDLNEKITSFQKDTNIYASFYFWMQNRMQYYERIYEKFQNVLSDVGGLCSLVLTFLELINILINQYINLFDAQEYMNEIEELKIYEHNIFKLNINNLVSPLRQPIDKSNNIVSKKSINILFPPKKKISQNINDSTNKSALFKEPIDIYDNNLQISSYKSSKEEKVKSRDKNAIKNKKGKNNSMALNKSPLSKTKFFNNKNKTKNNESIFKKITNNEKEKIESPSLIKLKDNLNINIKDKNKIETNEINNKKPNYRKINFFHYLAYLIPFTKYYSYIQLYSDFRIKMISEENLILSNLNIDKLFKQYIEKDINNRSIEENSKVF